MKLTAVFAAATFATALLTASANAAHLDNPNQLVDPSFEGVITTDGPPFVGTWEGFTGGPGAGSDFGTDMPRTGAQALQLVIDNTADNFAGAFQDVPIPASAIGQMSWFSGWHKSLGDSGGSEYRIEWLDAGGAEFFRNQVTVSPGSTYEEFIIPAVIPAGTATARLAYAIQSFGGALNQQVFVDDVNFNYVPEPSTAVILSLVGLGLFGSRRRG